jgi:L-asparaginase
MTQKKNILILHTGGTLGMELTGKPSDATRFKENIQKYAPQVFDIANVQVEILFNKDSSNFIPTDWSAIATTLDAHMDSWDAFLITHGTDTMAFTASALSFMVQNPRKPVFLTGSQRPLLDARSDAPRNLIYAIELAAQGRFNEVCLFFDALLMRGNRAKKTSIPSFHAFESPNFPPLAKAGVSTEFVPHQRLQGTYHFDPRICSNVDSISFFPGLQLPPRRLLYKKRK